MKLLPGMTIPDFPYESLSGRHESFLATLAARRTALFFHRFAGCRVCQLAMADAAAQYPALKEKGWDAVFVVQSTPENAQAVAQRLGLPFDVICDPEMELYRRFEVDPAPSQAERGDPAALEQALRRAEALGLQKGPAEGNPLQLPAVFVLGPKGEVLFSAYPKSFQELPSLEELARLA